ncbi:MAG: hypothetical protein ABRQ30_00740 [Smithellaceae bacterium]
MDPKQLTRQLMDFNKSAFDQSYKMIKILHDQTENIVLRFLERSNWITEDGKKVVKEWAKVCKKGSEYFKDCADENYKKIADYCTRSENKKKT